MVPTPMTETAYAVLAELEAWGRQHDTQTQSHGDKMLNLEPETAKLVSILIRSGMRRRVVEVGTSNGYSTIWLADAARTIGGEVISIEHNPVKSAMADQNLRRAELRDKVSLHEGDAA